MIYTTLNKIKAHDPCQDGWKKLLKHLGKTGADDEPLSFEHILNSNGLYDALWCCRTVPEYDKEWRLYAVWCARQVQHLMTDKRSIAAIDVAERYANGEATADELKATREAAWAAAWAAAWDAAGAAAREAALAAGAAVWDAVWDAGAAAGAAARDAVWEAARDAVWTAAWDAASAAAKAAAWDAAGETAREAAWEAQTEQFLKILKETGQ